MRNTHTQFMHAAVQYSFRMSTVSHTCVICSEAKLLCIGPWPFRKLRFRVCLVGFECKAYMVSNVDIC
jgi:hypothetical protein